jgi:hypothetical protein
VVVLERERFLALNGDVRVVQGVRSMAQRAVVVMYEAEKHSSDDFMRRYNT